MDEEAIFDRLWGARDLSLNTVNPHVTKCYFRVKDISILQEYKWWDENKLPRCGTFQESISLLVYKINLVKSSSLSPPHFNIKRLISQKWQDSRRLWDTSHGRFCSYRAAKILKWIILFFMSNIIMPFCVWHGSKWSRSGPVCQLSLYYPWRFWIMW